MPPAAFQGIVYPPATNTSLPLPIWRVLLAVSDWKPLSLPVLTAQPVVRPAALFDAVGLGLPNVAVPIDVAEPVLADVVAVAHKVALLVR